MPGDWGHTEAAAAAKVRQATSGPTTVRPERSAAKSKDLPRATTALATGLRHTAFDSPPSPVMVSGDGREPGPSQPKGSQTMPVAILPISFRPALRALPLATLLALACSARPMRPRPSPRAGSSEAHAVTITRDDWGIAHVHGKTDADAVFGMIYAQAEDDFNRVETNYLTALGRLAEAEGETRDLAGPAPAAVHRSRSS